MTNYEAIQNMSIEDMAVMLAEICIEKEVELADKLKKAGVNFSITFFAKEIRYKSMENWLNREAEEGAEHER